MSKKAMSDIGSDNAGVKTYKYTLSRVYMG